MNAQSCNILIGIFIAAIIIAIIYYLTKNDMQPTFRSTIKSVPEKFTTGDAPPPPVPHNFYDKDQVLDELIAQYDMTGTGGLPNSMYEQSSHDSYDQSLPNSYDQSPGSEEEFTYNKKKFVKRTFDDVKDLFDVDQMLPQEQEDWFDVQPLQSTKKINNARLVHPKVHMGINTVSGSKGGSHDLRGDIPIPRLYNFPWNNSTMPSNCGIRGIQI